MVKGPVVTPTVRVVHVCPPIVVHTSRADFPTVVQELTGVKNTGIISMKGSCSCHGHLEEFMESDGTALMRSSFMRKRAEEDGAYTLATNYYDHYMRACTHAADHRKIPIEAGKNDKNGTPTPASFNACMIECNNDNGWVYKHDEEVRPSNEGCFEGGLSNEEVCTTDQAVSVISSSELSSPNWTTASSYDNCMSKTREDDSVECIADTWTTEELSALDVSYAELITSKLMQARRSERRPSKKAKLSHAAASQEPLHMEHPHLHLFSDMECLSPYQDNMIGFGRPYSSLSPSDNDSEYMHAEFHNLLQNFEEFSTV